MEGAVSAVRPPRVARATVQPVACLSPAGEAASVARLFRCSALRNFLPKNHKDSIPRYIQELFRGFVRLVHCLGQQDVLLYMVYVVSNVIFCRMLVPLIHPRWETVVCILYCYLFRPGILKYRGTTFFLYMYLCVFLWYYCYAGSSRPSQMGERK